MVCRIEVISTIADMRATVKKKKLLSENYSLDALEIVDVYTIDKQLSHTEQEQIASLLFNPVVQKAIVRLENHNTSLYPDFDWVIEIGFLPGVKDNVAATTKEIIQDFLKTTFKDGEDVYSSQMVYLKGTLTKEEIQKIIDANHNPLIQRAHFHKNNEPIPFIIPKVKLIQKPTADIIDIISLNDEELAILGKQGIKNPDGSSRGPPALNLAYMKAIQAHCKKINRNLTDVEFEFIAQSWSEHCKHPKFADPIDNIPEGLFKRYIKRATQDIRKAKGKDDFCVSVFTDNSGAITFDDTYLVTDKCETHNSPSALDPFGGAITGIVGVNRDTMGFGLGAKPIINGYGYCFGYPDDTAQLFKDAKLTHKMLSPKRIMEGVIEGVNVGGNCSGIPTPLGFMYFNDRYKGKPLVFVRTLGLIPKETCGRKNHEKKANVGDYIVMIGGRVGKDGIHGATFASEALDSGSPATAVQIGDPITQKKFSDAIVKEARDLNLYASITDNGAGGLSSSVGEMAKESGGFHIYLDKVPVKYPGLAPWEIWISESQERMTLAIPKQNWEPFNTLMQSRGVEATIIGEFTNTGKCVAEYDKKLVIDMDMHFVHEGLPKKHIQTNYPKKQFPEPTESMIPEQKDLTPQLHQMLKRNNIASTAFITQQYDHEVQGGSALKPLQGKGRVTADTSAVRPVLHSKKAVVISIGMNPTYSDIDTYHMAACAIDTAIRNTVAAGGNLNHIALMDNFCWCSADDPIPMGQLKEAAHACYDYAVAYGTPFISGKDSMYNDFKGYDAKGTPLKISIPMTLLISTLGVVDDVHTLVSLDAKIPGDYVYILGETHDELGASEYYLMLGENKNTDTTTIHNFENYIGNNVPKVDANINKKLYLILSDAIAQGIIASAQSIHRGGLIVALAKTAMGGKLGMHININDIPNTVTKTANTHNTNTVRNDKILFSETQGRVIVTVSPQNAAQFEKIMSETVHAKIGIVSNDTSFMITDSNNHNTKNKNSTDNIIIKTDVNIMLKHYRSTFEGY